jgi:hypothetical protein
MKQFSQSFVGLFSLSLLACASFVACGGLDDRNVTRGPDEAVAGDTSSAGQGATGAGAGAGNGSGGAGAAAGGAEAQGGEPGNPFGGNLGEGGAPVVDGPPEVLKVDPADAADDAQPTGDLSLLFSEGLDAATVTSDTIKIMDGTTEVEGELSYEGVIATFAPSRRLSLLASYDVSVSPGITDTGGQALKAPFASRFTVREGAWAKQTQAFDDQGSWVNEHDSGTDAQGNTLVVWLRTDMNGIYGVFARWYRPTTGWQAEVALSDLTDTCQYPRVVVSPEGDAAVVWLKSDVNSNWRTIARRFVNGAWEPKALDVAPLSGDVFNSNNGAPAVAIGGGQVAVSWINVQYSPTLLRHDYILYQTAVALEGAWPDFPTGVFNTYRTSAHPEELRQATLAIDAKGNAISAFAYDAVTADAGVYYSRKAVGGSWQYAVKIPSSTLPNDGPFLVSDGDGAMAVWGTFNASNQFQVVSSRYTKAKQFAAPVPISDPDLKSSVSMKTRGHLVSNGKSFFATWVQAVGASRNAYATRYDIAKGSWDALPTVVSDGAAIVYNSASIGVDSHGNALVAFDQESPGSRLLMSARFTASNGAWAAPTLLAPDGLNYSEPIVSVAANGVASVLFEGGGRTSNSIGPILGGLFRIFR